MKITKIVILNTVLWALLGLLTFLITIYIIEPSKPFNLYVVESGSMEPAIPTGSVVITIPLKKDQYIFNDQVISFQKPQSNNALILHRIYRVTDSGIITKGDHNQNVDPWYLNNSLITGVYSTHIPFLGYIPLFFRSPFLFALMLTMPLAIILLIIYRALWSTIKGFVTNDVSVKKNYKLSIVIMLLLVIITVPLIVLFHSQPATALDKDSAKFTLE